ncbi:MAG: reverse transcriptase domain-containing protein, partial [Sedimenticola sp.]
MEENQAGFRKKYSTTTLIEILKARKQKLFCSFIDFSKAFDSVWRAGLWQKLLKNEINGKMFRIIFNMYQ